MHYEASQKHTKTSTKRILKKLGSVLVTVVLVMLCLYLVTVLLLGINIGVSAYAVLTGSMEPSIPIGSLIIVTKTDFYNLKQGDIITAKADINLDGKNETITHYFFRYEEIEGKTYVRTIAEGERFADSWVIPEERLIGKCVFIIPHLGKVTRYLSHPIGIVTIVGNILILSLALHYLKLEDDEEYAL